MSKDERAALEEIRGDLVTARANSWMEPMVEIYLNRALRELDNLLRTADGTNG